MAELPLRVTFSEQNEVSGAAGVWTDPMPTDRADQVAFFKANGFLILPQALTSAELDELRSDIDRLAREHATTARVREGYDLEPTQDENRQTPTFRKIGGVSELTDAFGRLLRHPRITDMLHDALDSDRIELFRDVVMMKPARVGREKPWHQDSVYWPYRPMHLASALTALDDATPENGCLQVIPGTHQEERQHFGEELQIDLDESLHQRSVFVPLKAGDTLLFHSLLLHASQPNRSDRDRRVCIMSYKPGGLEYIGPGERPAHLVVSERTASG